MSYAGGAMGGAMDVVIWGWWYGGGLVLRGGMGLVLWVWWGGDGLEGGLFRIGGMGVVG